jgi:hypothetical protein
VLFSLFVYVSLVARKGNFKVIKKLKVDNNKVFIYIVVLPLFKVFSNEEAHMSGSEATDDGTDKARAWKLKRD